MNAETFRARCQSILVDNAGKRYAGGQTSGGRLDNGRLSRVVSGNFRVFKRPMFHKFRRYGVSLLVDTSGSMGNFVSGGGGIESTRTHEASRAAHLLTKGLVLAGAEVSLYAFNTMLRKLTDAEREMVSANPLYLTKIDEEMGGTSHGNHDAYAVEQATRDLLARTDLPGKIVVVIGDGWPSCDHSDPFPGCRGKKNMEGNIKHLRETVGKLRKQGVSIFSIGIDLDTSAIYGKQFTETVFGMGEVFTKTAKLLERNIIRG